MGTQFNFRIKNFYKSIYFLIANVLLISACTAKNQANIPESISSELLTGAEQMDLYLPKLENKRVALVVNQTSIVKDQHLVDTLLSKNVKIAKVFAPEHGFRGDADAGEHVKNSIDTRTQIPIISLYGDNKKPTAAQLADVDVIIFDIQDVGARFYTYISTLHYVMEACAEQNKQLLILDRPNPNGHYVDGPVLDMKFQSFVGMHPIPIVHGLTVGELATIINGEKWLPGGKECSLEIIKNQNYDHKTSYSLPVKPSPNLPNDQAIKLYPSLCFFEGTILSLGRGTHFPFQVIGYPDELFGDFTFTPKSIVGMAKNPPYENKTCYGLDLRNAELNENFTLKYLIDFYKLAPDKDKFFNAFFNKLAGNDKLQKQIKEGMSESEIKKSWENDLQAYKNMRKQYLLYPDFN
ncbi:DUF1343 domain-containing protein [soil metagenome]